MHKIQATLSLALAAAAATLSPTAQAQVAPAAPLALAAFGAARQGECAVQALPAAAGFVANKSEAILGGRPSALDRLRQQQSLATTKPAQVAAQAAIGSAVVPGAARVTECNRLVQPAANGARLGRGISTPGSSDFLASRRLPISRTNFDGQWNRVRQAGLAHGAVAAFPSFAPGRDSQPLLAAVNAYANRRIRYVEDRKLYGRADYWATAGATLAKGAGDCEDIAIAKMQLLAAAGVPKGDMFLTIARDLLRKADHAVLVVRVDGRNWLLDNSTDRLVDADQANDYRPIFSFSTDRRWLHGY